jgi:hypothetical protein
MTTDWIGSGSATPASTAGTGSDLTWSDICEFVNEFSRREGATPNEAFYRIVANQALAEMSEAGEVENNTVWTDTASTGGLTIVGNTIDLLSDIINVRQVKWNGVEIDFVQIEVLDAEQSTWRSATGTPTRWTRRGRQIILNTNPGAANTGLLAVYGTGSLPEFSKEPNAANPLARIPRAHQLLPAYHIVANLPMAPAAPANDSIMAQTDARNETARRASVREDYQARYKAGLAAFADSIARRTQEPYTF